MKARRRCRGSKAVVVGQVHLLLVNWGGRRLEEGRGGQRRTDEEVVQVESDGRCRRLTTADLDDLRCG